MGDDRLESLCEINPEIIGPSGGADFRFRYIDISSVTKGQIDWSSVPILKLASAPSRARRRVRDGDVLLCTVRPGLQAHARIEHGNSYPLVASTGFAVLRPHHRCDSSFIFHLLFSGEASTQLHALETGSNYPAVNEGDVRRLHFVVPWLDERERIGAVLDTIDEAIAKTEAVIAKLKQVRAGLLHDLLTRGLDENGELRDPIAHPEQFEESRLGRIPTAWEVRRLTELSTFQNGRSFPSTWYCTSGVRLLRPGNLPASEFVKWDPKDTVCLPEEWVELGRDYVVRGGELIMNLTAQSLEEQFLGRVCMTVSEEFCLLNQRLARFRAIDCDLRFLFWSLRGPSFRRQIDRNPQGTKVQHIYNRDLQAVHLPVPKDRNEQTEIAKMLFSYAGCLEGEDNLRPKLESIRVGLRTDLLTGRVRVPESVFAAEIRA